MVALADALPGPCLVWEDLSRWDLGSSGTSHDLYVTSPYDRYNVQAVG